MLENQTVRDMAALALGGVTVAPLVGGLLEGGLKKRRAAEGAVCVALTLAPISAAAAFLYCRSGSGKDRVLTATAMCAVVGAGLGAALGALSNLAFGE